jgi:exosortase/archaeosortase family protein
MRFYFPSFITELLKNIPSDFQFFLKRVIILFIAWKLLYHFILFPKRILDRPLTVFTTKLSSKLYEIIFTGSETTYIEVIDVHGIGKAIIYINNQRGVGVGDNCNGLELQILFLGFLFCFKTSFLKKVKYSFIGIFTILILNIIRVTLLTRMNFLNYQYADFAHHYLFKMIIYSVVFIIWIFYLKKVKLLNDPK